MKSLIEEINELCAYDSEREWFEFKENWYEPHEIGEYISALSNSATLFGKDHGLLIWGIQNKTHKITGTTFNYESDVKEEPLKHYLARQLFPKINFSFEELEIEGKRVVALVIPCAKETPTEFDKERYGRIGSSKVILRKYPKHEGELFEVLRNGVATIENTPSKYQDLTFQKLLVYYGAKGLPLNENTFEQNLELRTPEGEYNILAQLLSDNSHMPLNVALFSGKKKSDNLFALREFGYQCILYSLDDILRYGDVLNVMQVDETNRVVERKEVPLFENDAFREAVINAFVHNRWVDGDEPMFSVYSDRIEILSRGTLSPRQTKEGFFAGESVPVNQKLSEIFLQLHISEKTGRGVPTITEKYGRKAFTFRENSIVVNIPFNWINVMSDRVNIKENDKPYRSDNGTKLNNTTIKIWKEIYKNPDITKAELKEVLGVGKTTIDRGVDALKKASMIERVGSNKTGYWNVLQKPPKDRK